MSSWAMFDAFMERIDKKKEEANADNATRA
jgi:hypothetical protein